MELLFIRSNVILPKHKKFEKTNRERKMRSMTRRSILIEEKNELKKEAVLKVKDSYEVILSGKEVNNE